MIMRPSGQARLLCEKKEGRRALPYLDKKRGKGVWTIGIGHTKIAAVCADAGIVLTEDQIDRLYAYDMRQAVDTVNRLVTVPLSQPQFDGLCVLVFNIGGGNFAGSTLLKLLNQGFYVNAADEFLKWNHDQDETGKLVVVDGLTKRREEERLLFLSGTRAA